MASSMAEIIITSSVVKWMASSMVEWTVSSIIERMASMVE